MSGPHSLTILRAHLGKLAKSYDVAANGQVAMRSYDKVATFAASAVPVADIRALHSLLVSLEGQPDRCIIRGEAAPGANLEKVLRRKVGREGGVFDDVPRAWALIDCDKLPAPASLSVLDDPAGAAAALLDMLAAYAPELEGVSAVVRFSASAGIADLAEAEAVAGLPRRWDGIVKPGSGPTISGHIWLMLSEPQDGAALKRWAAGVNARAGFKLVDPQLFVTTQPHYSSAPAFGPGLRDPLAGRRTLLIEREADAATLAIPEVAPRAAYEPGQQAHASLGYGGWLDAIGGADGFNGPIMRAVSAFVAANYPAPDLDALVADVSARVLAADPGGRGPDEIRRYASQAFIRDKAEWAVAQETRSRAERAALAAASAAKPVAPKYPNRAVPLAEAGAAMRKVMTGFATRIGQGETPHILMNVTVGSGKSHAGIEGQPLLVDIGKAARLGPVLFTHPRHKLGDQLAADIREACPGLRVAVWRGMDAADPTNPGKAMCTVPELPDEAKAAGLDATHGCTACPMAGSCSYLAQRDQTADVWVAAHQVVTRTPFAGWPRDAEGNAMQPTAIIVDEDPVPSWLAGVGKEPIRLDLARLEQGPTEGLTEAAAAQLMEYRRQAAAALMAQPQGKVFREGLEFPMPLGDTSAAAKWAKLEWDTKPKVRLPKGATKKDAIAAYREAQAKGFSSRRPRLAKMIGAFLDGGDARSVNITRAEGSMLHLAWREDIHDGWQAPAMLYLGATTRPELLRFWSPQLEVTEIEVEAPHQHVVQIPREFGRTSLLKPQGVSDVADVLLVEAAQANGETLAVVQLEPERLIRAELEKRGAVRDPLKPGEDEDAPATYRFPSGAVLHLA
ncbi:hypothetical protein, partial [Belnapia moabensis]|uniref:hypothetical protein n=1 Tax=Belnapia moabensis TaxID=365533 RepID=UPI0005BB5575